MIPRWAGGHRTAIGAALLSLLLPATHAAAQDSLVVNVRRANAFSAEFAVPESPAFGMLQVDQSAILRPTTVKDLATNLSRFTGDGLGVTLPREVGIEFSPALLWSRSGLTLEEYRSRDWLYRTRVSFATKRPDSTSTTTQLAFGIRFSIQDRADLRTNDEYIQDLEAFHLARLREVSALQDSLVNLGLADPEQAGLIVTPMLDAATLDAAMDSLDAAMASQGVSGGNGTAIRALVERQTLKVGRAELDNLRDSIQDAMWNADAIDVAVSTLLSAADSTGADLTTERWNAWATVGRRLGPSGQLLIGGVMGEARDTVAGDWNVKGSVSARLYFGSNDLKVLAEGQLRWEEDESRRWFIRGGAELEPSFGGWVLLTLALEHEQGRPSRRIVTDFSYNLGLQDVLGAIR